MRAGSIPISCCSFFAFQEILHLSSILRVTPHTWLTDVEFGFDHGTLAYSDEVATLSFARKFNRTCRDHNSWIWFSPCEAHRLQRFTLCGTCRDHNSWLRFSPCEAHRLQMLTLMPYLSRPQHRPRQRPATSSHKKKPTLRSRSPCASWAPTRSGVCAGCAIGFPRTAPLCP